MLVLYGDVPLVTAEALSALREAHEESGAAATMATMELDDPSGYGRVVRASDGSVERVVETKTPGDATPEELAIREVNAGIYAFEGGASLEALERLTPDNAQGELYLPDVLPLLRADGKRDRRPRGHGRRRSRSASTTASTSPRVRALAQARIQREHALAGVTIVDPQSTLVDAGVEIGRDTVIEPCTFLRGATPHRRALHDRPADDADRHDARRRDARRALLPRRAPRSATARRSGRSPTCARNARLREGAKAGTFVEIKNSDIGEGTKVPHLSYIGDADVGAGTNLGAGTITANYDGANKHRTTIGGGVQGERRHVASSRR